MISVVIASYNHEKYISKAIESVLNQTFSDFELIIVDDASTDNSLEVINSYQDKRIKLIALKENIGVCRAFNLGVSSAKHAYIKIFSSDDILKPNIFEKQFNILEKNPEIDAVFSKIEVIDENDFVLEKKTKKFDKYFSGNNKKREEWLNDFFFLGNSLAAPTVMIKKDVYVENGGFDYRFSQAHDFNLWVKILLNGSQIHIIPERLVQYRRISGDKNLSANTSRTRKRLIFDTEKVLENYLLIKNIEELINIFPESDFKKYSESDLIPYFLSVEALKVKNSYSHKQFAINNFYNLLQDDNILKALKEMGFTLKDFYQIVSDNPIGVLSEDVSRNICNRIKKKIKKFLGLK